jgi:hypothetical protein
VSPLSERGVSLDLATRELAAKWQDNLPHSRGYLHKRIHVRLHLCLNHILALRIASPIVSVKLDVHVQNGQGLGLFYEELFQIELVTL